MGGEVDPIWWAAEMAYSGYREYANDQLLVAWEDLRQVTRDEWYIAIHKLVKEGII